MNAPFILHIIKLWKYKKAIIRYNDGSNGQEEFYDYAPELFASCIFGSSRKSNFKWLSESENKITTSKCYYKDFILKNHGYKLIKKVDSYDKEYDKQLNIYEKINR